MESAWDLLEDNAVADARANGFDPRPLLFEKSLEAYCDETRHRVWACGRGAAKTTTAQLWLLATALTYDGCTVVIIANTAIRAKDITWPDFVRWNNEFHLGGETNKTTGTITFPNGSRLMVSGADRPELFDRKRGLKKLAAVVFEECQDWEPGRLEYAATKVFGPRLGDVEKEFGIKGRMLFIGTGTKTRGFFYRAFSDPSLGFGAKRWTQWDNPHIADAQGEFEAACKLTGVDPKDPDELTRREWFAEFNDGSSSLQIFRVAPVCLVPRAAVPTGKDIRLVIAGDYGTIDAAAAACWLYTPRDPRRYLVRATKEYGLGSSGQVKFVRDFAAQMRAEYRPVYTPHVVGDGGGLGKALMMDLKATERASEVESAEKGDKVPNFRMLAGELRTGTSVIVDDLKEIIEEFKIPEWHPDFVGEKIRGHVPDQIDAASYGWRKAKELHTYAAPAPEVDEEEARERKRAAQAAAARKLQDNPWG